MVRKCCVVMCGHHNNTCKMKVLPKDPKRAAVWKMNIGRHDWEKTDTSVCQCHFDETQFERKHGKKRLRPDAIPLIFPTHVLVVHDPMGDKKWHSPQPLQPVQHKSTTQKILEIKEEQSLSTNDHEYAKGSSDDDSNMCESFCPVEDLEKNETQALSASATNGNGVNPKQQNGSSNKANGKTNSETNVSVPDKTIVNARGKANRNANHKITAKSNHKIIENENNQTIGSAIFTTNNVSDRNTEEVSGKINEDITFKTIENLTSQITENVTSETSVDISLTTTGNINGKTDEDSTLHTSKNVSGRNIESNNGNTSVNFNPKTIEKVNDKMSGNGMVKPTVQNVGSKRKTPMSPKLPAKFLKTYMGIRNESPTKPLRILCDPRMLETSQSNFPKAPVSSKDVPTGIDPSAEQLTKPLVSSKDVATETDPSGEQLIRPLVSLKDAATETDLSAEQLTKPLISSKDVATEIHRPAEHLTPPEVWDSSDDSAADSHGLLKDALSFLQFMLPRQWMALVENSGIHVVLVSKTRGKAIQRSVFVPFNGGEVELYVHAMKLSYKHEIFDGLKLQTEPLTQDSLGDFLDRIINLVELLGSYEICCGVTEEEYLEEWRNFDDCILDSNLFGEEKYSQTVRSVFCTYLAPKDGDRCQKCDIL